MFTHPPDFGQEQWPREESTHRCPACDAVLERVLPSRMLVCTRHEDDHGPYWIAA